jgi:hypothetical protein
MTVSSELNRKTFDGDDATTSFATSPIVFFETEDLTVYVVINATDVATLLVEDVDYTVTGGDGSTGTVNLAGGSDPHGALFSGTTLVVVRELGITQEADLVNNDASDAEVLEDALDKGTMILQQLDARVQRAAALAGSDITGADVTLPTPAANQLIGWDDDGLALVNYVAADFDIDILVSAFGETLVDDATASDALTTLGVSAYAQTLLDDASAGDARTTLSVYSAAEVNAIAAALWTTGDAKLTFKTTADSGWVMMDDGTIGDASSGATTRANADTSALFTLLWNNTLDANCAVSTGRGANAAADFAAHKTIALPKELGRSLAIAGSGSGLTARALASVVGTETKTILAANLPASGLAVTGTAAAQRVVLDTGDSGGQTALQAGNDEQSTLTAGLTEASAVTGTTANMGSGTAFDVMNPRSHINVMVKL